ATISAASTGPRCAGRAGAVTAGGLVAAIPRQLNRARRPWPDSHQRPGNRTAGLAAPRIPAGRGGVVAGSSNYQLLLRLAIRARMARSPIQRPVAGAS